MEKVRGWNEKRSRNKTYKKYRSEYSGDSDGLERKKQKSGSKDKEVEIDNSKLMKPEFINFMQKNYKDTHDLDPEVDREELVDRYLAFENKGKVEKQLNEVFLKEFKGLTDIDDEVQKGLIEKYIAQEVKDNPDRITEMKDEMEELMQSQKELESARRRVEKYTHKGGAEGLAEKAQLLEKAGAGAGRIRRLFTRADQVSIDRLKDEYGVPVKKLNAEMEKVTKDLIKAAEAQEKYERLQQKYAAKREELLADLGITKELAEHARNGMSSKLRDMGTKFNTEPVAKLQAMFKEVSKIRDENEGDNLIFGEMDETSREDFDKFIENFNDAMEKRVVAEVDKILEKTPLGDLDKKLKPYLQTGEVGSNDKMEMRTKIRGVVEEAADNAKNQRRFMLKSILLKYKSLTE